jgi:hypothetical protein
VLPGWIVFEYELAIGGTPSVPREDPGVVDWFGAP